MTNIMRNAPQNATGHACIQDLFNIYFSKNSILLYFTLFLDKNKGSMQRTFHFGSLKHFLNLTSKIEQKLGQ